MEHADQPGGSVPDLWILRPVEPSRRRRANPVEIYICFECNDLVAEIGAELGEDPPGADQPGRPDDPEEPSN